MLWFHDAAVAACHFVVGIDNPIVVIGVRKLGLGVGQP
jgi:hypothetical protein